MLIKYNRPVGVVVKDFPIGAGGCVFDSQAGQFGHGVAKVALFHRRCVVKRGNGPRHSLHVTA